MLIARELTKRYGPRTAVEELSVTVAPGRVTGFLGPNGAGKSTTMRMFVGLTRPTSGAALVNGRPYEDLAWPAREVGALLDVAAAHPGRTARAHLRAKAHVCGLPRNRVDEVLAEVGLSEVADRRSGSYSLGMRQRLGVADALLADPGVLLFDEPVNGLDLDGVRWMRDLTRRLADEGRTVLVSSHLMSEMGQVADHLVVVGRGRLIADAPISEVISAWSRTHVVLRSPDAGRLRARLAREGVRIETGTGGDSAGEELRVFGPGVEEVGDRAYEEGVRVHGLRLEQASLEQAYLELTGESVEYGARTAPVTAVRTGADGAGRTAEEVES
ncbi:ATP-binding cassette domain-containing protein [Nocardiopsis ganjiahuensis]|uniref:ATP-binding cassette domain-containing protein n=1 Tax=Nocardiopsis ganjiahuensis TaxID=239984 RepID=UPI00034BC288|nr:ATP-binding cassette domain-containing protein [Nocardiopsis ganjiahuensis]